MHCSVLYDAREQEHEMHSREQAQNINDTLKELHLLIID